MLLASFGSFAAIVASSGARLRKHLPHDHEGLAAIVWFRHAMLAALKPPAGQRLLLSDRQALIRYLQADMGFASGERLRSLFLDARNVLLSDEVMAIGSATALPLCSRSVLARALELGASGLILVHNHPSGDPTPSRADISATASLQRLCGALEIELHDHVIVGAGRWSSMRDLGLLTS